MDLKVQNGKQLAEVSTPVDATVGTLKALLAPLTGQLVRNMKLIHKGRVLAPDTAKLESLGVSASANKLMLLGGGSVGPAATVKPAVKSAPVSRPAPPPPAEQLASRAAAWRETGLIGLRDANLDRVPPEAWALGDAARVLDLHGNARLGALPAEVAQLQKLTRLSLSACGLRDVAWSALCSLSLLTTLALDRNPLEELPEAAGELSALRKLTLTHCQLRSLPAALGRLQALTQLDAAHNALTALPAELSGCASLEELNVAHNSITALPASLGSCPRLATLDADSNSVDIQGVPPALLRAPVLRTLSLLANPVTLDQLRTLDGWDEFEAKRRAKVNKALGGGVLSGFEESADAIMRGRR